MVTRKGHADTIEVGRFRADGKLVVTGGRDGSAKVWDADTGALLHSLDDHIGTSSVAFSPRGDILATAGNDRAAKLWEVASGKLIRTLPPPAGAILEIAFDPVGDVLAIAAKDPVARMWDLTPEMRSPEEVAEPIARRSALRMADGRLITAAATTTAGRLERPGTKAAGTELRRDGKRAHVAFDATMGRIDVQLEQARDRWQIVNVRGRPPREPPASTAPAGR